jgi:hypothetical protein
MLKHSARRLDRSTTKTSQPATTEIDNYTTTREYKKLLFSKCSCPTCSVLGPDYIKLIYELVHIIEENNPQIFDPLNEKYNDEKIGVMVI